jgi:phosphoglycolate phosphatase-like HAD superfamily hydrolase
VADDPPKAYLVLWDVDHTLIETGGVGTQLYESAFARVTGRPLEHRVEITGRTELAIISEAYRLHGVEASASLVAAYRTELSKRYAENVDLLRDRGRALPGAVDALSALAGVPQVVQTVLTGNLRAVTVIKLVTFGLDRHLDLEVGAFGEDHTERAPLVAVAQRRAATKYMAAFHRANTVIVGDTVNDIAAAREGGARSIAVASGRTGEEELREARAEAVLPDLGDTHRLLKVLLQPG